MSAESPTPAKPASHTHPWAWPLAWVVTVLILVLAALYVFKSCRDAPGQIVEKVGTQLEKLAAAFNQGTITTKFTSYATTLSGSQYLQFATLKQEERFQRTDEATTGFGYIPLPEVIVEASAPVTYTYFLDLNDHWEMTLHAGVIEVVAPDIKFNEPSVDASRITYEVKKDSMMRNSSAALDGLKKSISSMVHQKAVSNRNLVRETGRKQVEEFVHNWLSQTFQDGKNYPVKVRFRNELPAGQKTNLETKRE